MTLDAAGNAWWKITPRYARSRAYWLVAFLIVVQLGTWLGADTTWWLEAPVHFQTQYVLLGVTALLLIAHAVGCERRFRVGDRVVAAAALGLAGYSSLLVLGWTPAVRALKPTWGQGSALSLRVLSANVYSANQDHQALVDLIAAEDADVIFLMEVNSRWLANLDSLTQRYSHRIVLPDDSGNFGVGLWSRLPMERGDLDGFGSLVPQVHAVLTLPGGRKTRFLGVHPLPPISARYFAQRNLVFDGITKMLREEETLPVIVAGDLNASRYAPRFQRLCREGGLYEAGHDVLGRSWPSGLLHAFMGARIDHVLIDGSWEVEDFRIGRDIGSDHYPTLVDLTLAEPATVRASAPAPPYPSAGDRHSGLAVRSGPAVRE